LKKKKKKKKKKEKKRKKERNVKKQKKKQFLFRWDVSKCELKKPYKRGKTRGMWISPEC
jgi:hypothetical protein